jgi:hypothetical protein
MVVAIMSIQNNKLMFPNCVTVIIMQLQLFLFYLGLDAAEELSRIYRTKANIRLQRRYYV